MTWRFCRGVKEEREERTYGREGCVREGKGSDGEEYFVKECEGREERERKWGKAMGDGRKERKGRREGRDVQGKVREAPRVGDRVFRGGRKVRKGERRG